jgi:Di-haem oxidoreductase, putative peroxidase
VEKRISYPLAVVCLALATGPLRAQGLPPALPEVFQPFAGDPRLEPLPDGPVDLVNVEVFTTDQFGVAKRLMMRFPPRVNGQNESDGDKHADLFVLFDATTLKQIDQPVILEAVPKNAASGLTVSDRKAREFSPIWELHAVLVESAYDPNVPELLIDSADKVKTSPLVREIIQTNIFLNCPMVPNGSTVAPGFTQPEQAFFEGQIVTIVPYDVEDGEFNVQILFKFEDQDGFVLGRNPDGTPARAMAQTPGFTPHLVASHALGDPFYTPIWEVWTVKVPNGTDVSTIRSSAAIRAGQAAGTFKVKSAGIRLDCPVVEVDGVPVPFEDAFDLLAPRDASGVRTFDRGRFPIDLAPTAFFKPRTFQITEEIPANLILVLEPFPIGSASAFPAIDPDDKGNVIPLILRNPFGPSNSSGEIIRIDQAELDAAFANNNPPRLPAAIEANFTALINEGLLEPEWAPGGRPYQERLALVGKALFKLMWTPEQGANQKDVTTCRACHSQPSDGASSRGLYTLERPIPERPEIGSQTNAGSMFGSGAAELLVAQKKAAGANITFAHGTQGQISDIRGVVVGANFAHIGIESVERIAAVANVDLATAATLDLDGDGVVNEMTVGEVTAETVFLMTTPVPDHADREVMDMMHVSQQSAQQGRDLFRRPIAAGGIGCASCHTPFHPLTSTRFVLKNPQTPVGLTLDMPHHAATQQDVDEGLATSVGQPGLRLYGDFKKHDMGAKMFANGGTVMKTAELWDVGSDAPLLRNGSLGSSFDGAIRAHGGEGLASANAYAALSSSSRTDVVNFLRVQLIQGKVGEGSGARPPLPPDPDANLTASAAAVAPGGPVTLSWSTRGADQVALDPGIGPVSFSGSMVVNPLSTTTFTLTASNRAGPVMKSVLVKVALPPPPPTPAPPTATLTAAPTSIAPGASATLTWSTTGASAVTLLPGIGTVASSGSIAVKPLVTTTYTLTATSTTGTATATAAVTVTAPVLTGGPGPGL